MGVDRSCGGVFLALSNCSNDEPAAAAEDGAALGTARSSTTAGCSSGVGCCWGGGTPWCGGKLYDPNGGPPYGGAKFLLI